MSENIISFGAGNTCPGDNLIGKSIGEIVVAVGPILGNGDNVEVRQVGVTLPNEAVYTGGRLELVTKACAKA